MIYLLTEHQTIASQCPKQLLLNQLYTNSVILVFKANLIGSLFRAIQQYSPPSEWIMCERGVIPIFVENDLSKVNKILELMFLRQEKTSKDSKQRLPIY